MNTFEDLHPSSNVLIEYEFLYIFQPSSCSGQIINIEGFSSFYVCLLPIPLGLGFVNRYIILRLRYVVIKMCVPRYKIRL